MKILVISHNPLCSYDSMGITLLSLLSGFKPEELCQLYIYPSIPNTEKCSSYYRITDKNVLKSFPSFDVKGERIEPDLSINSLFENSSDESIYRNPKNKNQIRMIMRDLMWKLSRWYNKDLKEWIKEQEPDCIFAAPGNAKFLYDIALKISKDYNIPIISYLCDEFYFSKNHNYLLKRKIEKYMALVSGVIAISEELTSLYSDYFSAPVTTIMTGSSFPISNKYYDNNNKVVTYTGSVRCNRYQSLVKIGRVLGEIGYTLGIYTSEKNEEILNELKSVPSIRIQGFVSGSEYVKALKESDFLLHVEAFDTLSIEDVKNSVSTKIADYLSSGVPLIAYGPDSISSMKHLIRNNCAIAITNNDINVDSLNNALSDYELRKKIVFKAIETANMYHNKNNNSKRVRDCFEEILRDIK